MPHLSLDESRTLEQNAQLVVAQRVGDTLLDPNWILSINSFSDHAEVRQRLDPDLEQFPSDALQGPLTPDKLDRARRFYTVQMYQAARKWAEQHGNGYPSIGSWALKRVSRSYKDPTPKSFWIDLIVDVYVAEDRSRITVWIGKGRYPCALSELLAVGATAKKTVAQAMTEEPAYRRDLIRWLGREKPLE